MPFMPIRGLTTFQEHIEHRALHVQFIEHNSCKSTLKTVSASDLPRKKSSSSTFPAVVQDKCNLFFK